MTVASVIVSERRRALERSAEGGRCRNSVDKCRLLCEVMVAWAGSCEVALVCGSIEVKRGKVRSFVDFCLFINGI